MKQCVGDSTGLMIEHFWPVTYIAIFDTTIVKTTKKIDFLVFFITLLCFYIFSKYFFNYFEKCISF